MHEKVSEQNMRALQSQFSEANEFYNLHIGKLQEYFKKEESKMIALGVEMDAVKAELQREKVARKALTSQLKKERKWRERCIDVTKSVIDLKAENNLDNGEQRLSPQPTATERSISPPAYSSSSVPQPQDQNAKAQTPSVAYTHPTIDAEMARLSGTSHVPKLIQSPLHELEDERRKNKMLMLELIRQRAYHNNGLQLPQSSQAGLANLTMQVPSPLLSSPSPTSPSSYFPFSSSGTVAQHEVEALRVAVERADIERVMEVEKDIEFEHLKLELEQEKSARAETEEKVAALKLNVDKAVEAERAQIEKEYQRIIKERDLKEKKKDEATMAIVNSSGENGRGEGLWAA